MTLLTRFIIDNDSVLFSIPATKKSAVAVIIFETWSLLNKKSTCHRPYRHYFLYSYYSTVIVYKTFLANSSPGGSGVVGGADMNWRKCVGLLFSASPCCLFLGTFCFGTFCFPPLILRINAVVGLE